MKQFRKLAIVGCVACATAVTPATEAGGYGSSGGSSGGSSVAYANYGGSSGGYAGYGGSSGGYAATAVSYGASSGGASAGGGRLAGLFAKHRARKAARRAAMAGGGSSGGYAANYGGSSGGYAGGYAGGSSGGYTGGSSGGSSGGYLTGMTVRSGSVPMVSGGSSGGYTAPIGYSSTPSYSAPATYSAPMPAPMSAPMSSPMGFESPISSDQAIDASPSNGMMLNSYKSARPAMDDDAALLEVMVPEDAIVMVNDRETASDGGLRKFMSRGLKDGYVYTYVVEATFDVDGEAVTRTKTVKLRPGDIESVAFSADDVDDTAVDQDVSDQEAAEAVDDDADAKPSDDDVVTTVRLRVPADAKVTLAGNPTNGNGPVRTFRTKTLAAGDAWRDYTVAVTSMVDGRAVTKRRTIHVNAGDTKDLEFDFAENTLASN